MNLAIYQILSIAKITNLFYHTFNRIDFGEDTLNLATVFLANCWIFNID